jgi:S-adenosylmethionine:tRNA ribosyltransferase-isomerase
MSMRLSDFDYCLPPELIAQEPAARRDASRLMTLDRHDGTLDETEFSRIADCFRDGDLLVLNDTRVIPARLLGRKETGGRAELFLVRRLPGDGERWQCLVRASKPPRPGSTIQLPEGLVAEIIDRSDDLWIVSFTPEEGVAGRLERAGEMPLPPYIKRPSCHADRERYQTVFSREAGAVAAPTAGLHFTPALLDEVRGRGVEIRTVTLHVGLGTFLPVRVENLDEHRMHREWYRIPPETAAAVNGRKRDGGGRVIALGTTTARALEHAAAPDGTVPDGEGEADIFIRPGYRFRTVEALITNFHLPQSTLLMLVAAFAGRDLILHAYAEAVRRRFRFFSYGDAMMIY